MMIREALPSDANKIAKLIIQAMDDLAAKFIGATDPYEAIPLFERFAGLPGNQYSYENILLYVEEGEICGMISAYDGADLEMLRAPFLAYIEQTYGLKHVLEAETQAGEYYLDCISVAPGKQGKGIGKELIKAMLDYAVAHHHIIGLLVSKENPKAEKLYANLGFKVIRERDFMGGQYFHMQIIR
ncbi:MAG: N-acetyltransferase [Candidatus Pedobacter colombiensis]|uniref:N-acetyltransferase n=1 Tax=Candidatus Pedobacter colombiensis TaxID=3121371 RepID=A0AAJ6B4C4_9SPHI|nr:N-acetyltransferase [Pedobacter sp.]WEK17447.1 MAG: N-acetyltransferase [Pedobacter sp.]